MSSRHRPCLPAGPMPAVATPALPPQAVDRPSIIFLLAPAAAPGSVRYPMLFSRPIHWEQKPPQLKPGKGKRGGADVTPVKKGKAPN